MSGAPRFLARFAMVGSILAMSACAAAPEEDNTPLALDGSTWALSGVSGGPLAKAASAGVVTLAFGPERVSGSGGCNRYQAEYTLDGNALTLGPVGATKRGCMDDRGETERNWFAVLGGPLTVSRAGDQLVLRDAGGVSYTLVAASDNAE